MRLRVGIISAFAAAASACAGMPPAAEENVLTVSIESWVWGHKSDGWSVDRDGQVVHSVVERLHVPELKYLTDASTISRAVFVSFVERLQPVRDALEEGIPCDGPLSTDQGAVFITWHHDTEDVKLRMDYGCRSAAMTSAQKSLDEAIAFLKSQTSPAH